MQRPIMRNGLVPSLKDWFDMDISIVREVLNPLVSVIVPIYNAEKTLHRCVESIISQTYHNLEIILINDGSLDSSLMICQSFAIQDTRIKMLDTPNQGVSKARNEGLAIARGQFIGFVDSDDWIDPEMYALLVEEMQTSSNNCMSVVGVHARRWQEYLSHLCKGGPRCVISSHACIEEATKPYGLRGYLWNKLFINNGLLLDEDSQVGEDLEFVILYLLTFPTSMVSNRALCAYHYAITEIHEFTKLRYSFSKTYSKVGTFKKIIGQLPTEHKNAIQSLRSEICMTCYGLLLYWYASEQKQDLNSLALDIRSDFLVTYHDGFLKADGKSRIKLIFHRYIPGLLILMLRFKLRFRKKGGEA
jgi:glycosyltransferase involved in cell wall biosynthesis